MKRSRLVLLAVILPLLASCSSQPEATSPPTSEPTASAVGQTGNLGANDEIAALVPVEFAEENISISTSGEKITVVAYSDDVTQGVLTAQSTGSVPDGWSDFVNRCVGSAAEMAAASDNYDIKSVIFQVVDNQNRDTYLLTITNGTVSYNLFDSYEGATDNPGTITLAEFESIQSGMEYQEVFDIIGSKGTVLSEADIGDDKYYSVVYMWDGEGDAGANANVMFQGGVVTSKAQFGLK